MSSWLSSLLARDSQQTGEGGVAPSSGAVAAPGPGSRGGGAGGSSGRKVGRSFLSKKRGTSVPGMVKQVASVRGAQYPPLKEMASPHVSVSRPVASAAALTSEEATLAQLQQQQAAETASSLASSSSSSAAVAVEEEKRQQQPQPVAAAAPPVEEAGARIGAAAPQQQQGNSSGSGGGAFSALTSNLLSVFRGTPVAAGAPGSSSSSSCSSSDQNDAGAVPASSLHSRGPSSSSSSNGSMAASVAVAPLATAHEPVSPHRDPALAFPTTRPPRVPSDGGTGAESTDGSATQGAGAGAGGERKERDSISVKTANLRRILQGPVDLGVLRRLAWSGVPFAVRPAVWQFLVSYLPVMPERRQLTLDRRREDYRGYLRQHYSIPDSSRIESEMETLKQIRLDVPRTHPTLPLFQSPAVRKCLERLLFIWSIRHPGSGYVQGINDLATPFFVVFLSAITGRAYDDQDPNSVTEEQLAQVEADTFWCLSALLDGIQDHYVFAQPGIQRMVFKLQELIARIDGSLYRHLEEQGVQFIQFAFRWMNCLLMRELSLPLIVRVWDTYLSEEGASGFRSFHPYVCAALLMRWSKRLQEMEFQDLVMFLQRLPTESWTEQDVETLLSQAFVYKSLFHGSPHHLSA